MNFDKLKKIMKNDPRWICVNDAYGQRWIGCSTVLCEASVLPQMTKESLIAFLDIPPKKQEKYTLEEYDGDSAVARTLADTYRGETVMTVYQTGLTYAGHRYACLKSEDVTEGLILVDETLLRPFDVGNDTSMCLRRGDGNRVVVAVKQGILTVGIVMPTTVNGRLFADVTEVAHLAEISAEREAEQIEAGL